MGAYAPIKKYPLLYIMFDHKCFLNPNLTVIKLYTHFLSTVDNEKSNSANIYLSVKWNNSKATVGLSLSSLAFTSGKAALPSSQLVKEGQLAAVVKAPRPLCACVGEASMTARVLPFYLKVFDERLVPATSSLQHGFAPTHY